MNMMVPHKNIPANVQGASISRSEAESPHRRWRSRRLGRGRHLRDAGLEEQPTGKEFGSTAELDGYRTRLLVDTGAAYSLSPLSERTWRRIGGPDSGLGTFEQLFTFTGGEIELLGKVDLNVRLRSTTLAAR